MVIPHRSLSDLRRSVCLVTTTAERSIPITDRFPTLVHHSALAVAGAFAITTAVLLMRVAHGSTTTALAILQAGGTAGTLMGTALTIAPYFGVILLGGALTFIWMKDAPWGPMSGWHRVGWTVLGVIVASMFLSIAYVPVAVLVAVAVLRSKSEPKGSTASLIVLTLVWLILIAGPWWPLERIGVTGAKRPLTGYVVSASGDDLVVLLESPRRLVHVEASGGRRICASSGLDLLTRESVWSLLADRCGYALCTK